jgi:proline dehydrogenase
MIGYAAKTFFHLLARSTLLKNAASRYGMRKPTSFARRFIAGEHVDEAIEAARAVEARGFLQTLDYLGESVRTLQAADAATA